MPDVWTYAPEKLRSALSKSGAECGMESRVLHPRDPEWTCHINTPGILYDIYIHPVDNYLLSTSGAGAFLVMFTGAGIILGLLWGKRFWRNSG